MVSILEFWQLKFKSFVYVVIILYMKINSELPRMNFVISLV